MDLYYILLYFDILMEKKKRPKMIITVLKFDMVLWWNIIEFHGNDSKCHYKVEVEKLCQRLLLKLELNRMAYKSWKRMILNISDQVGELDGRIWIIE